MATDRQNDFFLFLQFSFIVTYMGGALLSRGLDSKCFKRKVEHIRGPLYGSKKGVPHQLGSNSPPSLLALRLTILT